MNYSNCTLPLLIYQAALSLKLRLVKSFCQPSFVYSDFVVDEICLIAFLLAIVSLCFRNMHHIFLLAYHFFSPHGLTLVSDKLCGS